MAKFKYIDFIKALEDDKTINIIGKIDIDFLKVYKIENLYYSFPLIERLILEIFKLSPMSDIEYNEQGTMRTVIELLKNNNDEIPEKTVDKIMFYFKEDGLRNKVFHVKGENLTISVDFDDINSIIYSLLNSLKRKLDKVNNFNFGKIDYL